MFQPPELEKSIFCIVDMQEKFMPAISEMSAVSQRIQMILRAAAELKLQVAVSEQYPQGLGRTLPEIMALLPANTPVFEKTSFSCFGSEEFRKYLVDSQCRSIFLAGVEAHVCVMQTAIDLAERGFQVFVIYDSVASRRNADKEVAIRHMEQLGINVIPPESFLFMLLKTADHPAFRAVSKIIR